MLLNIIIILQFIYNFNAIATVRGDVFSKLQDTLENMGFFEEHGNSGIQPEAVLSTVEIIEYYGYPAETHHVVTDDGYILEIHRIPGNKYNSTINNRPPVYIQHGIMCTSACWLLNGVKDSLGFILADESYDTWLGNVRGNRYCRRHTSMTTEDSRFFDYNLDDHALSDLPAVIDYVLKITGSEKVTYIGHSLGATIGLFLLAGKPEYNKKINHGIFFAPVIHGRYNKNPLRIIGNNIEQFTKWYQLLGTKEITPFSGILTKLINTLCIDYPGVILCESFVKLVTGYNDRLFDLKRANVITANIQGGSSWTIIQHFAQLFITGRPARYDYGPGINLKKYGDTQPPAYNFSQISTKVSIFYGYMDLFTDVKDIETLAKELKNINIVEKVEYDTWCHTDFFWAIDAKKHFYERLVRLLKQFK